MRRADTAAVILLAVLFVLSGCDTGDSPTNIPPDPSIVCLGDSLTEGYGATISNSYPAFLKEKVTLPVVNAGISGDTAANGLARVERDVLSNNPQVVIVLLGANDFMRITPANDTKNTLQAIINMLKDENRKIYLASFIGDQEWEAGMLEAILEEYKIPEALTPLLSGHLSGYKKIFDELCAENSDIGYIPDIWTGILRKDHMSDPIHPNAAGYRIMAENIFNAARPYLEEHGLLRQSTEAEYLQLLPQSLK